jgi:hypothetical protein
MEIDRWHVFPVGVVKAETLVHTAADATQIIEVENFMLLLRDFVGSRY